MSNITPTNDGQINDDTAAPCGMRDVIQEISVLRQEDGARGNRLIEMSVIGCVLGKGSCHLAKTS